MKLSFRFMAPAALVALAWSSFAEASEPLSVYARVDSVTYEPDKASATRIQIKGVFALHTGAQPGFFYSPATPGYMYYTCTVGQESACREQWLEIENSIGTPTCAGWGQSGAKANGAVRVAGTPPTSPDTYDLGMGVQKARFANGTCPKLLAFNASDSGPPPLADGGSSGSSGSSGSTGSPGAAPSPGGTPAGTPAPQPGAGASNSGGCALVAPSEAPLSALAAAGALAVGALLSRRRRK